MGGAPAPSPVPNPGSDPGGGGGGGTRSVAALLLLALATGQHMPPSPPVPTAGGCTRMEGGQLPAVTAMTGAPSSTPHTATISSGFSPLSDAERTAARSRRFAAPGPPPPPPKPRFGGLQGAARATNAPLHANTGAAPAVATPPSAAASSAAAQAAAALFRLSRAACASLLAASLAGDALIPVPQPSFDPDVHAGTVVVLHSGLFYVERIPGPEARSRTSVIGAAAAAAMAARDFAMVYGDTWLLSRTCTSDALDALLSAAASAAGALERPVSLPTETVAALATHTDTVMPALRIAISSSSAVIEAAARAEGNERTARSLQVRTHGHLLHLAMCKSVAWDAPTAAVPATAWLRGWTQAALQSSGAVGGTVRPGPRDTRAIVAASGWTRRTKRDSGFPFPRIPYGPNDVATCDVAAIVDAYEAAYGVLSDTDVLWTLFAQMYLFVPAFSQDLHDLVAASPGAYRFPGTDAPHTPTPLTAEAEGVKLPELISTGVCRQLTTEAALAHGNVISPLLFVPKGPKMQLPPALATLIAAHDGAATPATLAAVAAAAQTTADSMLTQLGTEVARGTAPALAADIVYAAQGVRGPVRACLNGHHLSGYINCTAHAPQTVADVLRVASATDLLWAHDFKSYFFCFVIHPDYQRFFVQRYAPSSGPPIYLIQQRLSMGVGDSGQLAQAASALCCELAMAFGCWYVAPYVDDLMAVAPAHAVEASVAAIARAMDLCIPGGEAKDKRLMPAPINTLIGQRVDLPAGRIFVPLSRFYAYCVHLFAVQAYLTSADPLVRAAVTTVSTEKLVGKLAYVSEFSPGGRIHLHALYAQNFQRSPPCGALRGAILADLAYWTGRALAGSLPIAHLVQRVPSLRLNVRGGGPDDGTAHAPVVQQSDAGEPAGAAILNGHATVRLFTTQERALSSDWREMCTVVHGVQHFLPQLRGRHVLLVTDHSGNAFCINKGNAASPAVRGMIRQLYELAERESITFVAVWTPRESNAGPDLLAKSISHAAALAACATLGVTLDACG